MITNEIALEEQALGFQILWITIFWFRAQRSWETVSNNNFFGSVKIQGYPLLFLIMYKNMLLNILLNKEHQCVLLFTIRQCLLKCQKKVKVSVKCVSIKVSKTPDSSSIQLKKYTQMFVTDLLQCSKLRPFWSPWRVEKNFGD